MQELNDSQHQRCSRRRLRNPEAEQALGKTRLELSEPLLELRIKSREVELVQLPEVRPISRIDHIEPIHELVGNVITKLLIELARQFGRDRHRSSWRMPGYHNSTLGKPWYQENAGTSHQRRTQTLDSSLRFTRCSGESSVPAPRQTGAP